MPKIICPICAGTGVVDNSEVQEKDPILDVDLSRERCPGCKGSGEVWVEDKEDEDDKD